MRRLLYISYLTQSEIDAVDYCTSKHDVQIAAWENARTGNAYYLKQDPITGVSRPYASAKDLFIAMNMNLMYANNGSYTGGVQISTPTAPNGQDAISVKIVHSGRPKGGLHH